MTKPPGPADPVGPARPTASPGPAASTTWPRSAAPTGSAGSGAPAAAPPLRIVVADDERMVRTALRAILAAEPDLTVVGEAATGAEAVSVVRQTRPDVVLMDVRMPGVDGIRATERILAEAAGPAGTAGPAGPAQTAESAQIPESTESTESTGPADRPAGPRPRVIVVTTFENDSYVYDALRAGASGFLLKRADADTLVRAVRLVAHSDTLLFPAAVRALAVEHARSAPAPWVARLTGREGEVLRLVAAGLTNAEIARRMGVGPATVKSHVAAVLAKTGARDRTQAVIAAYEAGFMNMR
nr:response regulator transcription factor [Streptomyces sp. Xyl84]